MTLCISFKHIERWVYDQSFALTDSRITVMGRSDDAKAINYLPTTLKLKHQTDRGIKLHIIKSDQSKGGRDIVASVAGSVLLGLQSLIYIDSAIQGLLGKLTFDRLLNTVINSIEHFWDGAYDQEVEYLFKIADDDNKTRILHVLATRDSKPTLLEIRPENGVVLGVIGDQSERVRQDIFSEINRIMILRPSMSVEAATLIAAIRAMRRETEDPQNLFVGGPIQMAAMKGVNAYYMASHYKTQIAFRSALFGPNADLFSGPFKHVSWDISLKEYDPQLSLEDALSSAHDSNGKEPLQP